MSRRQKPFVKYSRGPMNFIIIPRGAAGWTQFSLWIAVLVPHLVWFETHLPGRAREADLVVAVLLFVVGLLGWLICGIWWMLARAEVVDVGVLRRDRALQRRKAQLRQQSEP